MRPTSFLAALGVAACLFPAAGFAADRRAPPVPFEKDGLWGYRSGKTVVIQPAYQVADGFSKQGIAAVVDANGWAYIDVKGRVLVRPFVFDNGPDDFREGLARCVEDHKVGFFDESGRIVIAPRFTFARPFSHGRAEVCTGCAEEKDGEHSRFVGGRWFAIDRTGRETAPH
jgi:WG containing repeat